MSDDTWAMVAAGLDALVRDRHLSGIALITQGDRVLLESCHGLADRAAGTPVTPATRFGLASMCKMFTALAALDAVRRGELALHRPVVDLLPASRRPSTLPAEVTVHHLLTHTSGIGDYAEEDEEVPGFVEDYAALWHDLPSHRMERVDDFLPPYRDLPPVAPAGAGFHYCNSGYLLVGAVVEEVTGRGFTALVTERVLGPAGMADSGYFRLDAPEPDLATGYHRALRHRPRHRPLPAGDRLRRAGRPRVARPDADAARAGVRRRRDGVRRLRATRRVVRPRRG